MSSIEEETKLLMNRTRVMLPDDMDGFAQAAVAQAEASGMKLKSLVVVAVAREGAEIAVSGCDCTGCLQSAMSTLAKLLAGHVETSH